MSQILNPFIFKVGCQIKPFTARFFVRLEWSRVFTGPHDGRCSDGESGPLQGAGVESGRMQQGWYFTEQVRDVIGPQLEPRDRLAAGSSAPGESDEVGIGEHALRRPHRVVMKCKAPWSLDAWLPILALKCTSYYVWLQCPRLWDGGDAGTHPGAIIHVT